MGRGPYNAPVVGGFPMLSCRHKLSESGLAGVTSEMSGLATYLLGVLVSRDQFWMAATITVASMLLLELKGALEVLTKRISGEEIQTFTKFLLLTAVVLPVLPNQEFGPFQIDPASKVSCSWTGLRCSGLCRWFGWRVNSRRIPAVRPVVPD